MRIFTLAILLFILDTSYAFNNFRCTIKDAVNLESDGTLNHKSNIVSGYLGKEFVVNRSTGLITGASIINNASGEIPSVYDRSPTQNAYRAVTHYRNNAIDYLRINQYVEGKAKPFFLMDATGTMVSGTCTVY